MVTSCKTTVWLTTRYWHDTVRTQSTAVTEGPSYWPFIDPPHPHALWQLLICSLSLQFHNFKKAMYQWNHTAYTLSGFVFFTQFNSPEIHLSGCVYQQSVPFHWWVVCHGVDVPQLVYHSFMKDTWADSFFGTTNEAIMKIHCAHSVGINFTASGVNAQECNCRVVW